MKIKMSLLKDDWYGVELRIAFCLLLKMYMGPQFCPDAKIHHCMGDLGGRVNAG